MQTKALLIQQRQHPQTMIFRLALLALLCAAMFIGSGKSFADTKAPPAKPAEQTKGMHAGKMEKPGHKAMDELNLTDKQKTLFRDALKQMHESMKETKDIRNDIRTIVQSDNYDEKKIRNIIETNDKEREENVVKSSKAMHEFYASLDQEQKTKFKKMQDNMQAHMKERMKEHGAKPGAEDAGSPE